MFVGVSETEVARENDNESFVEPEEVIKNALHSFLMSELQTALASRAEDWAKREEQALAHSLNNQSGAQVSENSTLRDVVEGSESKETTLTEVAQVAALAAEESRGQLSLEISLNANEQLTITSQNTTLTIARAVANRAQLLSKDEEVFTDE